MDRCYQFFYTQTHTHTHTYIYIYIYKHPDTLALERSQVFIKKIDFKFVFNNSLMFLYWDADLIKMFPINQYNFIKIDVCHSLRITTAYV